MPVERRHLIQHYSTKKPRRCGAARIAAAGRRDRGKETASTGSGGNHGIRTEMAEAACARLGRAADHERGRQRRDGAPPRQRRRTRDPRPAQIDRRHRERDRERPVRRPRHLLARRQVHPRRRRELGHQRRRHDLHLPSARRRQMVERRSGDGRRLRLFLPPRGRSGDGVGLRADPFADRERRRRSSPARHEVDRASASSAVDRPDAVRSRSTRRRPIFSGCSPTTSHSRCTRRRSRSSATIGPGPATWSATAPSCWPTGCRNRSSPW